MNINIALFVLLVGAAARLGIEPELEPKSDAKFFGNDYPDDRRPPLYSHEGKLFSHPYPTVQDSDRYDKDYVKDENDDGGYWKAQLDYDAAKNALGKEQKELKQAMAKAQKEKNEMQKASADYQRALAKEAEADKEEQLADAEHDKANGDMEKLLTEIAAGANEVDEEIVDLDDCKNKLIQKKAELKKLMAEKAEAEKKEAEMQADEDGKEVLEKEAEKKEAEAEKKMAEEQEEHEEALKSYEEEKADVKKAEKDLEKQAEVLRKFRKPDPDGGVYRSDATSYLGLAFPALLATLVALA